MSSSATSPLVDEGVIPETMRAVVVYGPGDYRLEDRPVPKPGAGDLLLRTDAVGICASDLKCYHGAAKFWGDENRPAWAETNRIPGHEFVGTIVAGDDATLAKRGVALGDRIACEQIVPCWECLYCLEGHYWMCDVHDMFGFKGYDGAMAEYVLVPAKALTHPVSRDLPGQVAAFSEPLSCAFHAVERADIKFDDTVVIAGAGPIGLSAIAGARQKNPLRLIALDVVDSKLELAKKVGADLTINIANEDAVARVKELTGGVGAGLVVEASGHSASLGCVFDLAREEGRVAMVGINIGQTIGSHLGNIQMRNLTVRGCIGSPGVWPSAIRFLERTKIDLSPIQTHDFTLGEAVKAFDLGKQSDKCIKVTLFNS